LNKLPVIVVFNRTAVFKYREFQSHFRYQLLETDTKQVLWERWQVEHEDSPHEVVASDEGWGVLRTHGFKPEVVAISPSGQETLRVRIYGPEVSPNEETVSRPHTFAWLAQKLIHSTAGMYWTASSWPFFLRHNNTFYFIWRTWWGQRLIMDLDHGCVLEDGKGVDEALGIAIAQKEGATAAALVSRLMPKVDEINELLANRREKAEDTEDAEEPAIISDLHRLKAAINLIGFHRVDRCIPDLQAMEKLDCPAYSTSTTALRNEYSLQVQHFRPIIQHSLRLMGAVPSGFATYNFCRDKKLLSIPDLIQNRLERTTSLNKQMNAFQVLELLGSPDFIHRTSRKVGKFYVWPERWDYDFLTPNDWETLSLQWEEEGKKIWIADISRGPSTWMNTTDRESRLLGM
jgi:hypothetical protein